jgi:hypothetical protein
MVILIITKSLIYGTLLKKKKGMEEPLSVSDCTKRIYMFLRWHPDWTRAAQVGSLKIHPAINQTILQVVKREKIAIILDVLET